MITSNLKGHGFHGDKATILYFTLKYYSLSVLSEKLYFLEIGPVNQKLWPFKYMMNVEFKFRIIFEQNYEIAPAKKASIKDKGGFLV